MKLRRIRRGGEHYRVADPSWKNPLDGRFAGRRGGRWNPPDSFPVVYLNASLEVARANVLRRFAGQPFGPEDLDSEEAPVLVIAEVPRDRYVDVVTDEGCEAAGLPVTYPRDGDALVGWDRCQPVGQRAWDEGAPGIAGRSAAPGMAPEDEELAWLDRGTGGTTSGKRLRKVRIEPFEEWFWPG